MSMFFRVCCHYPLNINRLYLSFNAFTFSLFIMMMMMDDDDGVSLVYAKKIDVSRDIQPFEGV